MKSCKYQIKYLSILKSILNLLGISYANVKFANLHANLFGITFVNVKFASLVNVHKYTQKKRAV